MYAEAILGKLDYFSVKIMADEWIQFGITSMTTQAEARRIIKRKLGLQTQRRNPVRIGTVSSITQKVKSLSKEQRQMLLEILNGNKA